MLDMVNDFFGFWAGVAQRWRSGSPKVTGETELHEDFQASPKYFYELVEKALERRKVPELTFSRVYYREGWIFSAKREYLRIKREKIVFDICCAPFGTGLFISIWLVEYPESNNPISRLFRWFFRPITYYRADTIAMYRLSVKSAVAEATKQLTSVPTLTPSVQTEADKRAVAQG